MKKKEVKFLVLDITLKGGVERFIANMAILLNKNGYEVKIYSFHRTNKELLYKLPSAVDVIYLSGFPFRSFIYKIITFFCCLKVVYLSKAFSTPFVIVSTSPIITIFLSWISPKLLSNCIASEHSTYSAHANWIRALRLRYYRGVKCVVTQTIDGAKRFAEAGLPTAQIPNACTTFSNHQQWTRPTQQSYDSFTCLSVARFEEVKQLDHYIEMANIIYQQCPNIHFELVGAGHLEKQLRRRVELYGLSNVFHIYPPSQQIDAFYSKAQVYLITSKSEAFPMTMIEALSFGVPVIAYDELIGPKEVIHEGVNGFLCKQNQPAELAAKVLALYYNYNCHKHLPDNSLKSAQDFHENTIYNHWVDIL